MLNPRSIPACGELFDIEMIDDPIHRSALACAGNSHSCWIFNINQSVHPRLRGELAETDDLEEGESRFIPAYAGNSKSRPGRTHSITVHPRLRGELGCSGGALSLLDGSSPLTRGTRRPRDLQLFDHRFIPAYAGNSGANPNVLTPTAVHPRLRGELRTHR